METQSNDLQLYLAALRRRKLSLLTCMAVLFGVIAVAVFLLPSIYRSTATILIEEQEIPEDLVPTAISSEASQRLEIVSQLVMTDVNLGKIVQQFNLYPDLSDRIDLAVASFRDDMYLEKVSIENRRKQKAAAGEAFIAFKLAYESTDPETALEVTNKLTALYLGENVKTRSKIAAETKEFLSNEVERLDGVVADLEVTLADYKKKYPDQLSEFGEFNQKQKERLEQSLLEIDRKVRMLQAQRVGLKAKLSQTSSALLFDNRRNPVLDTDSQLEVLRSEYISLSSRYSAQHPDVVKIKEQIAALEATQSSASAQRRKPRPSNPVYVDASANLSAVNSELSLLMDNRKDLIKKLAQYETMHVMSSDVEREYLQLKRNYDNTLEQYKTLRAKEMRADLGHELEKGGLGGRYTLIDPPKLPVEPVKPNRLLLLVIGLALALTVSIGYVAVLEAMDPSIRGARDLAMITGSHPLAAIPNMR